MFDFGHVLLLDLLSQLLVLLLIKSSHATELVSSQSRTDEVAGLLAFKRSSVELDPNNFLANWTANSSSPCSWVGVSCSLDGHVTALSLNNAGLIGSLHLPDLIAALPFLRHLSLQGNLFSAGNLSVSTATPCALEFLDLSSNNISDPLPSKSFTLFCDRLAYVNLSCNYIPSGTLHFGPSLLQLDLSRNLISDSTLLNYFLTSCQNLIFLNFSDNKLAGRLEDTPMSCRNLSVLDLSYNLLSGEIPPGFIADSQSSLKHIDLSHNSFSGKFSSLDFGNCSNLTFLSLSQNMLSGGGFPISMSNCEVLETLDLSHNELQLSIPGALLGRLKNL